MNERVQVRTVWAAAAIALAAGAALSAWSFRATPAAVRALQRKHGDIRQLQALRQAGADDQAAVRLFEALPDARPPSLADILRESAPELTAEIRQKESGRARDGWIVRRADVVLNNVSLERVAEFLYNAESRQPGWRMSECQIAAAERAGTAGRVTLVMEALERTAGGESR